MNQRKLKIKYHLGLWKTLESYPTTEDVVYEILDYLIKDGRPGGEFSDQTYNSIWGEKLNKVSPLIEKLKADNVILLSKTTDSGKV